MLKSAAVRANFIGGEYYRLAEPEAAGSFFPHIGKGDVKPLLSMPDLSEPEEEE